jgi:hypothetical protein
MDPTTFMLLEGNFAITKDEVLNAELNTLGIGIIT